VSETAKTLDPERLQAWVGRTEIHVDRIAAKPVSFMEMTLDRVPALSVGDALPPLWHWLYFLETAPMSRLGRDGHPAVGGFLPAVDLPRRMWAGGRLAFEAPLRIGGDAEKTSRIKDVALKEGRTGRLCFVTVEHRVAQAGTTCIVEEQDIVYREDPAPDAPPPPPAAPPQGDAERRTVTPSEVMLFRYSALTFNGHRIHYDLAYAREVEGYDGLVFHGPLTATLLAGLATEVSGRPLRGFSFRAVAPLLHTAPFTICAQPEGEKALLWAETPAGHLAMKAEASFS